MLQSNNGLEFCNAVIESCNKFGPSYTIVHGKSCHRQSQGSVERANQDVEKEHGG